MGPMIRVAVIDDHPAICAGLAAVLRTEAGLFVVGVAHSGAQVEPVVRRERPDVVLLDQHLPDEDGVSICRRIKAGVPAPAVVMFSAFTTPSLAVSAMVAGADGVLDKGASAHSVCEAVRRAARGLSRPWELCPDHARAAEAAVDTADLPLLQTLLRGLTPGEAAAAHGLDVPDYDSRVERILTAIGSRGRRPGAAPGEPEASHR